MGGNVFENENETLRAPPKNTSAFSTNNRIDEKIKKRRN
jgi:hypothetical protein